MLGRIKTFAILSCSDGVPWNAFLVALVVGAVLNLINQGDVLFGEAKPDILKACLTFLVPYMVSTHGQVTAQMRTMGGGASAQSLDEG